MKIYWHTITTALLSAFFVGVAHGVTLPWVTIGDAGNAPDSGMFGSFGAVDYVYRIGKYEVINDQYAEFLNAVARADPHDLYHPNMDVANDVHGGIQRNSGDAGFTYFAQPGRENKPVTYIDFLDTVRFANWLHNDQPSGPQTASTTEDGAYTIVPGAPEIIRNPTAKFFLPNDAEWYKAAYYKGGDLDAGYWEYPTVRDHAPAAEEPPGCHSANYGHAVDDLTDVGAYPLAPSPYGTFDQGGNVHEINETLVDSFNQTIRGSAWDDSSIFLRATYRGTAEVGNWIGFRVAGVPEPGVLGDFDFDGDVDGADFLAWQRGEVSNPPSQSDLDDWQAHFGDVVTEPPELRADFNDDGMCDSDDLLIWETYFGAVDPFGHLVHEFGDADEDSDIDGSDFLIWQTNYGIGVAVTPSGDFDNDGDTDGADFLCWQLNDGSQSGLDEWQANFGNVASSVASTGVPEPTSGLLLLLGMAAMLTRRGGIMS